MDYDIFHQRNWVHDKKHYSQEHVKYVVFFSVFAHKNKSGQFAENIKKNISQRKEKDKISIRFVFFDGHILTNVITFRWNNI